MYIVIIVCLSLLCLILAGTLIIRHRTAVRTAAEIREIRSTDTNRLIHSSAGALPNELINEINAILKDLRQCEVEYQRKNHDLEQMMTNISHDLRTPLTSAMGYINMAGDTSLPDEERERSVRIAEKRMERLEELISSFFEFSRMISSGKVPEKEVLNLNAVLEESAVHYFDDYCARRRAIDIRGDTGRLLVSSNRNTLMRIFDNLISNALKHGSGDLIITVTDGERAALSFENGLDDPGLDPRRIFDEFYTTDISRTRGNTGLGLAIAKQFTMLLGGEVSAECSSGRFRINIEFPKQ